MLPAVGEDNLGEDVFTNKVADIVEYSGGVEDSNSEEDQPHSGSHGSSSDLLREEISDGGRDVLEEEVEGGGGVLDGQDGVSVEVEDYTSHQQWRPNFSKGRVVPDLDVVDGIQEFDGEILRGREAGVVVSPGLDQLLHLGLTVS